jgi:hypothetical protein
MGAGPDEDAADVVALEPVQLAAHHRDGPERVVGVVAVRCPPQELRKVPLSCPHGPSCTQGPPCQLQLPVRFPEALPGNVAAMRRVIRRHIRRRGQGVDLAVDVNAVIAINRGGEEPDAGQSGVDATQRVQRVTVAQSHAGPDRVKEPPKEDR